MVLGLSLGRTVERGGNANNRDVPTDVFFEKRERYTTVLGQSAKMTIGEKDFFKFDQGLIKRSKHKKDSLKKLKEGFISFLKEL